MWFGLSRVVHGRALVDRAPRSLKASRHLVFQIVVFFLPSIQLCRWHTSPIQKSNTRTYCTYNSISNPDQTHFFLPPELIWLIFKTSEFNHLIISNLFLIILNSVAFFLSRQKKPMFLDLWCNFIFSSRRNQIQESTGQRNQINQLGQLQMTKKALKPQYEQ